ncbi:hypothetical protein BDW22DRAFT_1351185 [Trametopsis cervina]|nr:hypothetical protein BDW22DRAFT_1351185 [Trametopsis cervina]
MSFEHAPVTKGLMIFLALSSVIAGIFDVKHNLHLQLVPHLSKHHQYWRLLAHHLACASSSDLLLTELVLYNAGVNIERAFSSIKYASFLLITLGLNTIGTMLGLLCLQMIPVLGSLTNQIPAGPTAMIFTVLYQYFRVIPDAYQFKIFGVTFSDKVWVYGTASQLAIGQVPATLLTSIVGITVGYVYRSDMMQLKGWRIPHSIAVLGREWMKPILGAERPTRRTYRVLPEGHVSLLSRDEVVTTARPSQTRNARERQPNSRPTSTGESTGAQDTANRDAPGVVRQWVSELAGAANVDSRGGRGGAFRVPPEAEIQMLTIMFPDLGRDVLLGVLQRSPNLEAATDILLSSDPPHEH